MLLVFHGLFDGIFFYFSLGYSGAGVPPFSASLITFNVVKRPLLFWSWGSPFSASFVTLAASGGCLVINPLLLLTSLV
jgi:hypothetical protein